MFKKIQGRVLKNIHHARPDSLDEFDKHLPAAGQQGGSTSHNPSDGPSGSGSDSGSQNEHSETLKAELSSTSPPDRTPFPVNNMEELKKILQFIKMQIRLRQTQTNSVTTFPEFVTSNLPDAAVTLDQIATMCGTSADPEGLGMDIAGESSAVLRRILRTGGTLHWAAAGLTILASILDRVDQMGNNKKDCLRILEILSNLGGEVLRLIEIDFADSDKLTQATAFIVGGVYLCSKYSEYGRIRSFGLAKQHKLKLEELRIDINQFYQDLTLSAVVTSAERSIAVRPSEIPLDPYKAEYPEDKVGLGEKVTQILKDMGIEEQTIASGVQVLLLHGMGGVGKTTLGKAICAMAPFSGRSIAQVELGEDVVQSTIRECQSQIYERLSGSVAKIGSCDEGRKVLADYFKNCCDPILLFIDNVFKMEALRDLLPKRLPDRSRILLTSRDTKILEAFQNSKILCKIYLVSPLDESQAKEVFKMHLGGGLPDKSKELDIILTKCRGLPLALEIIAAYLRRMDNDPVVWTSVIRRLEDGHQTLTGDRDSDLDRIFKFSYELLDKVAQQILLDLACLLRDADSDWGNSLGCGSESKFIESLLLATRTKETPQSESFLAVWSRHKYLKQSVETYSDVEYRYFNKPSSRVQFHDLALAFCQNLSSQNAKKRLLLENTNSLPSILQDGKGDDECKKLEGLVIKNCSQPLFAKKLDSMHGSLRILVLQDAKISGICNEFPRELEICSVHDGFPYKAVDCLENLRILEIRNSVHCNLEQAQFPARLQILKFYGVHSLRYFHEDAFEKCRESLRVVHIIGCSALTELPTVFCELRSLSVLVLAGNEELKRLPAQFRRLRALQTVYIDQSLEDLPNGFGDLENLRALFLRRVCPLSCSFSKLKNLEYLCLDLLRRHGLPHGFENLLSLKVLYVTGWKHHQPDGSSHLTSPLNVTNHDASVNLPRTFRGLSSLEVLMLLKCDLLEQLPEDFLGLKSLKRLELENCSSLQKFHKGFGSLRHLEYLSLRNCDALQELPEDFSRLKALRQLKLECASLKKLPDGFASLPSLRSLTLKTFENLQQLPETFSNLKSLKYLRLECKSLEKLPEGFGSLHDLKRLKLRCYGLQQLPEDFPELKSLKRLELNCASITKLPDGFGSLRALRTLQLNSSCLQQLPEGFSELKSLKRLELTCASLKKLPEGFGSLPALRELTLKKCENLQKLPGKFSELKSLEFLKLECKSLERLPEGFGSLPALRDLIFQRCESLRQLPASFSELKSLEYLKLQCKSLERLPEGFGSLHALQTLSLRGCRFLTRLPDDFSLLTSLKTLDLQRCKPLKELLRGLENELALEQWIHERDGSLHAGPK